MTHTFDQLWAETYRHAARYSPYYRELFHDFENEPRLQTLPTVDKRVLSDRKSVV